MANTYRKGAKSVHRSIFQGGQRFDVRACSIDAGGTWGPTIPPGPRCWDCFVGMAVPGDRQRRTMGRAFAAGTGAALAALVAVTAISEPIDLEDGVSTPTPTYIAVAPTPRPTLPPSFPPLTPVPSVAPSPTSTATAEPTPQPTDPPIIVAPTLEPTPEPTAKPTPTPAPTCFHPGNNNGRDECDWPHSP